MTGAVQHWRASGPCSRFSAVAAALATAVGGASACVDGGGRRPTATTPGGVQPATCDATPRVSYSGNASIPSAETPLAGPYAWKNVVIEGGGFVTAVIVSQALKDLAFARTDVGGAYRFDPTNKRWWPITDWAGHNDSNLTGIESIASDPVDPSRVYMAAGEYITAGDGVILRSTDMGQTWARSNISAPMGGNVDGRSMGERLAIDPNMPNILYLGSRNAGLWKSVDSAQTWAAVSSFTDGSAPVTGATGGGVGSGNSMGAGFGLTFVVFDASSGSPGAPTPSIYVGVGVNRNDEPALFHSSDAGTTWEAVAGGPPMMMPHHAVFDGCGNAYFAYNDNGGPGGSSNVTNGAILRYEIGTGTWTDVSPPHGSGGFGGIAADAQHPGTLLVTTFDRWPGQIYRTQDGGATWTAIGSGAAVDVNEANWLFRHASSFSLDGWLGDVELDPFDSSHAFYVTGQGLWSSNDVTAADAGAQTHWTFEDNGLEETVVLDLASAPAPGAPLLSGVADISGFRHDDLSVSPANGMYSSPLFGNTSSVDFAELSPLVVGRVGTSSSSAGARGAYSTDGGQSWTALPNLPVSTAGTSAPSSGSIAVSADGSTFVWAADSGLPSYWRTNSTSWTACSGLNTGARVAADRVNPSKFYASSRGIMYVSTDGGVTFTAGATAPSGRPRPVPGVEGDLWVATTSGLFRSRDSGASFQRLAQVAGATAVGFGAPCEDGTSSTCVPTYPAAYIAGSVAIANAAPTWGIFRSDDAGASWTRIDDTAHEFGFINCLTGDRRTYGRVYLGTGGRGILYGDPRPQ